MPTSLTWKQSLIDKYLANKNLVYSKGASLRNKALMKGRLHAWKWMATEMNSTAPWASSLYNVMLDLFLV